MGRWRPDARERLERAALEHHPTFFRHFTDKREVLFAGEDDVPAYVAQLTADAPDSLNPMTLIVEQLQFFAAAGSRGDASSCGSAVPSSRRTRACANASCARSRPWLTP